MEALSQRLSDLRRTCVDHTGSTHVPRRVMAVLRAVGGPFEQASIDEAYLDVTEATGADWDKALALCEGLQREIVDATGLTAPFGLGPTRLWRK